MGDAWHCYGVVELFESCATTKLRSFLAFDVTQARLNVEHKRARDRRWRVPGAEFMCGLMKIQFGCYSRGTPHGWNLREWDNYCGSFGMAFLRAAAVAMTGE